MKFDIDKILSRLSHISQIGLLLAAIFTIWYTVIPLYGKTVLEEQVAKKEIELKDLSNKIDEQYIVLKDQYLDSLEINLVNKCITFDSIQHNNLKDRLEFPKNICILKSYDQIIKNSLLNENDKITIKLTLQDIIVQLDTLKKTNSEKFKNLHDENSEEYILSYVKYHDDVISIIQKNLEKI